MISKMKIDKTIKTPALDITHLIIEDEIPVDNF